MPRYKVARYEVHCRTGWVEAENEDDAIERANVGETTGDDDVSFVSSLDEARYTRGVHLETHIVKE